MSAGGCNEKFGSGMSMVGYNNDERHPGCSCVVWAFQRVFSHQVSRTFGASVGNSPHFPDIYLAVDSEEPRESGSEGAQ
jgi:hypothetical protein